MSGSSAPENETETLEIVARNVRVDFGELSTARDEADPGAPAKVVPLDWCVKFNEGVLVKSPTIPQKAKL